MGPPKSSKMDPHKISSSTTTKTQPPMVAAESPSSLAMDLDSSAVLTPGASAQPAQVPAPPSTDPSSRGRKRALEGNLQIDSSNYYKMRLLVKDLRPHVLEVLRTPDFRNSNAAIEIREKMKLMLQLHREMIGETPPKREKTTQSESLSNGKVTNQTTQLPSSETSSPHTDSHGDKLSHGDGGGGTVVVGGSAFGWNFITSGGTQAVYCGMSKEEYRSSHPIIQAEVELESTTTTHDK